MSKAVEADADGLIGPTHSFAGLAIGNLASAANEGLASDPRAAALQGLAKMARLAELGLPQFVLPPHERPDVRFLRALGFGGSDAAVLDAAARDAPEHLAAAGSASAMWAANAATVTPSADAADGRMHLTPANLLSNLHRSLEPQQTGRALRALLPDPARFEVHSPLPAQPQFADEGGANHVRLSDPEGGGGVELFVWGREAGELNIARQTRSASEALVRRHGGRRAVLARQSAAAIDAGAFHNDVVCVGAGACLFHHEAAFADTAALHADVRRAAEGLFAPEFLVVTEAELPLGEAIRSYLFNSMLVRPPGEDRLVLIAPVEVRDSAAARAAAERITDGNGPIGRVEYVEVRESMRNGGGPACLRLRLSLTPAELAAANPAMRFDAALHARLADLVGRRWRDRLLPGDLADPALLEEGRGALDELAQLLGLGGGFYPFQRT